MDKFMLDCLLEIETASQIIEKAVGKIIGWEIGGTYTQWENEQESYEDYQSPVSTLQLNQLGNEFDNQSQTLLLEEVKAMIIELKIKGSVRERANGLIELRTQAFGSIYGRTSKEIEQKLTQKLKEEKGKKRAVKERNKAPLLSEFFNSQYLPYKQAELSDSSINGYVRYMSRLVKDGLDKPINKYTAAEIEKYLLAIPQTRTRQILRGVFNNIFTYAKRIGVIKTNPCDNVLKVKHEKENGQALSFEAQEKMFDSLFSNTAIPFVRKAYIMYVYLTGTRRNEALSITARDVDFEKNVLHIGGTKTKGSNRYIPLSPLVEKLLRKLHPDSDGRLFTFSENIARELMSKVAKEYHLHDLRHTFGTIAICVQKLDAKTVSLYMGHSTVNMTLTTYTHPEQLNQGLFYDGSKTEEEKLVILRQQYSHVLTKIENYLA